VTVIDGAQSIGHMPVDVRAIDCDFFAFSGHKMAGVTGIGALYGRRALLDAMPPYQGGGGMISNVDFFTSRWKPSPERFEAGTPNFADAVALGAACDYLDGLGREQIAKHDAELAALAYRKLATLPGIRLLGPTDPALRSGLVSFAFPDVHAHDVVTFADEDGIALRGGHHCNQPMMRKLGLTGTTRASFYVYNTPEEIDLLVTNLAKTLKFFTGGGPGRARTRRAPTIGKSS
jgi:cysteine desulfurase / selenocysteine lyase